MAESAPQPNVVNQEISRRSFLKLGWGALLGFFASSAGATLRFIFPNVLYEPPQTFKAGHPGRLFLRCFHALVKRTAGMDYPDGRGYLCSVGTLQRTWDAPPNWFQAENRFRCPWHGDRITRWPAT